MHDVFRSVGRKAIKNVVTHVTTMIAPPDRSAWQSRIRRGGWRGPISRLFAASLLSLGSMQAHGEESLATVDMLRALSVQFDAHCEIAKLSVARPGPRPIDIYLAQAQANLMCICLPIELGIVQDNLNAGRFPSRMSEAEFNKRVQPVVHDKCAAEYARAMFGDGCPQRFPTETSDNPHFCECVAGRLAGVSDSELAATAIAARRDFENAVEAQRKGLPRPEPSALSRRSAQIESSCRARASRF